MTFERGYQIFVRTAYIAGIAIILIFLPFSKYILSIGMWTVTGAWILDRMDLNRFIRFFTRGSWWKRILLGFPYTLWLWFVSIGKGFRLFFRNRPAMVLASLYLLHILGLFLTSDFHYAFKDLRTKAPMLILPLFFSTSRAFGSNDFYRFILLFIVNLVIVTLVNTWNLIRFDFVDVRDISAHISHIILALMIVLSMFYLGYFAFRKRWIVWWLRGVSLSFLIWFLVYLVISRSFTGISVLVISLMILLVIYTFRSRKGWLKAGCLLSMALLLVAAAWYLRSVIDDFYREDPTELSRLEVLSPRGNAYLHNPEIRQTENGHYVWINIQWEELREAWNQRSAIPFDSSDLKGQPIRFTLIHFLTSKGERKDYDGVSSLENKEIEAIEKGIGTVVDLETFSLRGRIYEILKGYEHYRQSGDPTGSSSMQRLEFWKASMGIIAENWLTGVGTGDMNEAFDEEYTEMQTKLAHEQRWRSHNQYLSIFIAFGVFGFLWFLVSLLYPAWVRHGFSDYFFLIFFLVAMISLLTGDTLESQAGVSFFYFFYAFLLFGRREQDRL